MTFAIAAWTHANCVGLSSEQYLEMMNMESFQWRCLGCTCFQLPFADNSSLEFSRVDIGTDDDSIDKQEPRMTPVMPFGRRDVTLVLGHLNISSKFDELQIFLENRCRVFVLGLSETCLDNSLSDAELKVPGFNMYRKDRNRRGS